MNILLVDDIVINRFIIREFVKNLGHTFKEADNGLKAIELFQEFDFDVVFMDIEMPVMNGIETAYKIRNSFPSPKNKVKIFAITAYNPAILHEEVDTSNFNGVVTKPFSIDKIKNILNF